MLLFAENCYDTYLFHSYGECENLHQSYFFNFALNNLNVNINISDINNNTVTSTLALRGIWNMM